MTGTSSVTNAPRREAREALAAYAHEAWSGWMKYMWGHSSVGQDGSMTLPAWAVERWTRQMNTPYDALPEQEKESDRIEADRMLAVMAKSFEQGGGL